MVVFAQESGHSRFKHPSEKDLDPLADGYLSWIAPPPVMSRSSRQAHTPYAHFAMIAIDWRGCVQFQTSQSLEGRCRYIFTQDVKERFIEATGAYSQPPRMEVPQKRRRLHLDDAPDVSFETVDRVPLRIGETDKVLDYYASALRAFQQINCRQIAKAFIKMIEPRKQVKHPYNGGRGPLGEKGDPEKTKPDWWPAGVEHREPDHLKKPDRVELLVHIIRNLRKSHNITTEKLEEAGRDVRRQLKPRERWDILEEIYAVRRMEESYERGEVDADAVMYVINRDPSNKGEPDSDCLSDSGHASIKDANTYAKVEDNKPGMKYLPVSDFLPSPVEQISTPVTTDAWSFQPSMFHPVYDSAPASLNISQPQAQTVAPILAPTVTTSEMQLRMPTQLDYMPLAASAFPLNHSQLVQHHGNEVIPQYK
ncbi:predicted protein [Uncinocarpus reesii 1704]|uniref:Subtelomeric hrmA-associated cluster protein AFUB-079030/YDR124W-like helical bundle domain-containing protein n=1 Tax=Uncinocarpus reesii (strain UAMH 1704) TaxID=336963 RepID=C4JN01_UNCRE|nr:uncharacterized protein UREG_04209 [Uncinocarpus reesii 1704]EEP79363.1 predicted protein [Uncinocarpus reesii 1704]